VLVNITSVIFSLYLCRGSVSEFWCRLWRAW